MDQFTAKAILLHLKIRQCLSDIGEEHCYPRHAMLRAQWKSACSAIIGPYEGAFDEAFDEIFAEFRATGQFVAENDAFWFDPTKIVVHRDEPVEAGEPIVDPAPRPTPKPKAHTVSRSLAVAPQYSDKLNELLASGWIPFGVSRERPSGGKGKKRVYIHLYREDD